MNKNCQIMLSMIRQANTEDISRIAEILIFSKRINYRSIFHNDLVSFGRLQVVPLARELMDHPERLSCIWVYDDGIVKGMLRAEGNEVVELYVDDFFHGAGIGTALLNFAVDKLNCSCLWVLEKNTKALHFYHQNGFLPTGERKLEDGTEEYICKLSKSECSDLERIHKDFDYEIFRLTDRPEWKDRAAQWFHERWGIPAEAYLESMDACLAGDRIQQWYLCVSDHRIVSGLGEIANDFHDHKDLTPNICAVYTDKAYRCHGLAGELLNFAVEDNRSRGISPLYLLTDHTNFYERYGWQFLCMVQGDSETKQSRMYIHN